MKRIMLLTSFFVVLCALGFAQEQAQPPARPAMSTGVGATTADKPSQESLVIPKGAKVFIAPMPDNFNDFIKTAIEKKQVPVSLTENREQADYEISGFS